MSSGTSGREVVAQVDRRGWRGCRRRRGPWRAAPPASSSWSTEDRLASMIAAASVRVWMSVAQVRGVLADELRGPFWERSASPPTSSSMLLALVGQHLAGLGEGVEHLAELLLAGDQGGGEPVEAVDDPAERVVLLGEGRRRASESEPSVSLRAAPLPWRSSSRFVTSRPMPVGVEAVEELLERGQRLVGLDRDDRVLAVDHVPVGAPRSMPVLVGGRQLDVALADERLRDDLGPDVGSGPGCLSGSTARRGPGRPRSRRR